VVERTGRPWEDFRRHLMAAISDGGDVSYWESWVVALDRFICDTGLL
jgi:hypothetical protein